MSEEVASISTLSLEVRVASRALECAITRKIPWIGCQLNALALSPAALPAGW